MSNQLPRWTWSLQTSQSTQSSRGLRPGSSSYTLDRLSTSHPDAGTTSDQLISASPSASGGTSYAMHVLHQLANFDFELWTSHHNFIARPYHFPSVYPLPAYYKQSIVFKNPRKTTNPVTQWSTISTSITRPHT